MLAMFNPTNSWSPITFDKYREQVATDDERSFSLHNYTPNSEIYFNSGVLGPIHTAMGLGPQIPDKETQFYLSERCSPEPTPQYEILNESNIDTIFLSSAFMPHAEFQSTTPDLVLYSSDGVHFSVHLPILEACNAFCDTLPSVTRTFQGLPAVPLKDNSVTLNIILHAVYGRPCTQFNHPFPELSIAIDRMPQYGIDPKHVITQASPLHDLLISLAPFYPLQSYMVAARHQIESMAVACSTHLLSFPLHSISDEVAEIMGPIYYKRLLDLQYRRQQELRQLLLRPFQPHPSLPDCDFDQQQEINRAWALVAAHFTLEARADVSNEGLKSVFGSLEPLISCADCKNMVLERMNEVVGQWSLSKNTI